MIDDAQKKKSRSRAFRNPMRLADEHAEMLELLRDLLHSGAATIAEETAERTRALIAEVDKP